MGVEELVARPVVEAASLAGRRANLPMISAKSTPPKPVPAASWVPSALQDMSMRDPASMNSRVCAHCADR